MQVITQNNIDLEKIDADFQSFVLNETHPCIMAKAVFKMQHYDMHAYEDMHDASEMRTLLQQLREYLNNYRFDSTEFRSFVAVFPNNQLSDEVAFEKALWKTLQMLHDLDDQPWDSSVSTNPDDAEFSFSLQGRAFYVIGLHPESSRMARQAPYTTLVFNLHCQFEKLREMGTYQTVRDTIRRNDEKLQGSINPVLRDFGDDSETKQYSGRNVERAWKCPFHHKSNN